MVSEASPLVSFALRGLSNCWQPELGWFSHAFRLDPEPHNVSVPVSDLYYTLNVLLGFASLPNQGRALPYDVASIFSACGEQMTYMPVPTYAYGMAMWASAELQLPLPDCTRASIVDILSNASGHRGLAAQDLGLLISGVSRLHAAGDDSLSQYAEPLYQFAVEHLGGTDSGLFFNNPIGLRRRFATYATGVYMTLACFHFGEAFAREDAVRRALKCTDALASKQGPLGEWPWFYEANSGRVVDHYQVYSVHQDGMAPAYLHLAEKHGCASARNQIESGFKWVLGQNAMSHSMLVAEHGIVLRSQVRDQSGERYRRALRGVINWASARQSGYVGGRKLRLNRECRSYHLGWILHSFANREDYRSITHDAAFASSISGATE